MPEELIEDCCQLVKQNSIDGIALPLLLFPLLLLLLLFAISCI
jgi:hypothetical protein